MHFIEELAKQIRSRGPNSRTYVLVLNTFPCECTHAFKILIWSYQYCSVFADKKRLFFGKFLPNMGGWGHSFPNENHNFWTNENSPFVLPNLTKTLGWVGGWVNTFGRDLPKKNVFFWQPPLWQCQDFGNILSPICSLIAHKMSLFLM